MARFRMILEFYSKFVFKSFCLIANMVLRNLLTLNLAQCRACNYRQGINNFELQAANEYPLITQSQEDIITLLIII